MRESNRNPVAVCAAQFWTGSTGSGLCDGLRAAGWHVHEIDIQAYSGQPGTSLATRIMRRLQNVAAGPLYRERILADCETVEPDLFLTVKGVNLDSPTLDALHKMGITTCNYYPDFHFGYGNFDQQTISAYDHFVTTKSFQIDWLNQRRGNRSVHFVPHGYCGLVHQPVYRSMSDDDYLYDVGYAGNHSDHKADQLGALIDHMPDLDLGITGPNWKNLDGWPNLKKLIDPRERRNIGFAQFIQRSRINLAIHYGAAQSGWQDMVSTRSFEIPACGGFMLHIDNDEIREYFDVGSEIDVFSSIDEMADKIAFYLERPELREKMIAKSMERAIPAYSYEQRAKELLAEIGQPSA